METGGLLGWLLLTPMKSRSVPVPATRSAVDTRKCSASQAEASTPCPGSFSWCAFQAWQAPCPPCPGAAVTAHGAWPVPQATEAEVHGPEPRTDRACLPCVPALLSQGRRTRMGSWSQERGSCTEAPEGLTQPDGVHSLPAGSGRPVGVGAWPAASDSCVEVRREQSCTRFPDLGA